MRESPMKVMVTVDFSVEECRAIADAYGDRVPAPYGRVQDWMSTTILSALDNLVAAYNLKNKGTLPQNPAA